MLKKILTKFSKSFLTAMSLVVALAWNEAFKSTINMYPYLKKWGPWVYAFIITILSILFSYYIEKIVNKDIGTFFDINNHDTIKLIE